MPDETIVEHSISPFSLEKKVFLFNRFYFDLLKKIKNQAKKSKQTSKSARHVLRAIRSHYGSYETGSAEYFEKLQTNLPASFWEEYASCPVEELGRILASEEWFLYEQIHLANVASCVKDAFVIHHYLTIFAILKENASQDDITRALEAIKTFKDKDLSAEVEGIADPTLRTWITRLHSIYEKQVSSIFQNHLSDMETTSIGRLAKEIMEEVDLSSIQNSMENPGNIFQALADPNSGIASLLGTVSQKMIGKLASGEIRQENLLEDAMKFASKLPGMIQGRGTSSATGPAMDLTNMASMMQTIMGGLGSHTSEESEATSSTGAPNLDIASVMKMVQGMMSPGGAGGSGGSGGIMNMLAGLGGADASNRMRRAMASNPQAVSAAKTAASQAKRSAMAQKIRNKMEKRKAKENVPDQVE